MLTRIHYKKIFLIAELIHNTFFNELAKIHGIWGNVMEKMNILNNLKDGMEIFVTRFQQICGKQAKSFMAFAGNFFDKIQILARDAHEYFENQIAGKFYRSFSENSQNPPF